jgi:hypothetical protein
MERQREVVQREGADPREREVEEGGLKPSPFLSPFLSIPFNLSNSLSLVL